MILGSPKTGLINTFFKWLDLGWRVDFYTLGGLVFVLFATWYAASSQNNAAAYLLFFTLSSLFIVSIPHALLNVASS